MSTFFPAHPADNWLPFASSSGKSGTVITEQGPAYPLGHRALYEAVDNDKTLYYTSVAGVVYGASKSSSSVTSFTAGATDIAIKHYAGTGDMEWVLIYAAEAIPSGAPVVQMLAGLPSGFSVGQAVVEDSDAGDAAVIVKGVAQHDIASGTYAFVLRKGKGYVRGDAGISVGDGLIPSGSNDSQVGPVAAVGDTDIGYAIEASSAGNMTLAMINCKG